MKNIITAFENCINKDAINNLTLAELKQLTRLFPANLRGRQGERTLEQINQLMQLYTEKGGYIVTLQEGPLGWGLTLLVDCDNVGLKTFVIREYAAGDWGCTHTVRGYNKIPAKYAKMLEENENAQLD